MNFSEEIKLIPRSGIFLSEDEIGNFTRIFRHIEFFVYFMYLPLRNEGIS